MRVQIVPTIFLTNTRGWLELQGYGGDNHKTFYHKNWTIGGPKLESFIKEPGPPCPPTT